jgi:hypothetical protein
MRSTPSLRRATVPSVLAFSLLFAPPAARAQSDPAPRVGVAAGWAQLHGRDPGGTFEPWLFVSVEGTYRPWFTVVGQFGGSPSSRPARVLGDPAAGTGAFLAGTRLNLPDEHHVVPFGQLLVGFARSGDSRNGYPALGIQPGAGVDVEVHRHVALRLSADYRRLVGIKGAAGDTASATVLGVGLVVR